MNARPNCLCDRNNPSIPCWDDDRIYPVLVLDMGVAGECQCCGHIYANLNINEDGYCVDCVTNFHLTPNHKAEQQERLLDLTPTEFACLDLPIPAKPLIDQESK